MSDLSDFVPRSDILALAARIRELEAQLIRTPGVVRPGERGAGQPVPDTNCTESCFTCCSQDGFDGILLPGELERLSGSELVKRLEAEGDLHLVRRTRGGQLHDQPAADTSPPTWERISHE
jgi:hypothetical protein